MAQDFMAVVETGDPHTRWGGGIYFGIDLMMGIWTMWLYSAIAPRYGAEAKAAAIAGIAWWAIKSLQSEIGAWLYQKVEMRAPTGRSTPGLG